MPDLAAQPPTSPDALLAALLAEADAATGDPGPLVPSVLAALVEAGGALPWPEARALVEDQAGDLAAAVLVALLDQPADRRRSPTAEVGRLTPGGPRWLWVTRSGYRALGSSAKGGPPSPRQADHRAAIRSVAGWLATRYAVEAERRGVAVTVTSGGALRAQQTERRAAARDELVALARSGQAATGGGLLVGGVYPDALLAEAWPGVEDQPYAWPALLTDGLGDDRDLDHAVAVEVELTRKASEPLTTKLRRHLAAATLPAVPYWRGVLWVIASDTVATQLLATLSHLDPTPLPRTGHYLVPSHLVGGPQAEAGVPCYWPAGAAVDPAIREAHQASADRWRPLPRRDDLASMFDP